MFLFSQCCANTGVVQPESIFTVCQIEPAAARGHKKGEDVTVSRILRILAVPITALITIGAFAQDTKSAKLKVLVICTGNSARSQMTASFLKSWDQRLDIYSAGTAPAPKIDPGEGHEGSRDRYL
jgi:arsenate reductase